MNFEKWKRMISKWHTRKGRVYTCTEKKNSFNVISTWFTNEKNSDLIDKSELTSVVTFVKLSGFSRIEF